MEVGKTDSGRHSTLGMIYPRGLISGGGKPGTGLSSTFCKQFVHNLPIFRVTSLHHCDAWNGTLQIYEIGSKSSKINQSNQSIEKSPHIRGVQNLEILIVVYLCMRNWKETHMRISFLDIWHRKDSNKPP